MVGEEIIKLKFKHLRFGVDRDGDSALLFTFVDRKSLIRYKKKQVTFYIYPNPQEKYIDTYKFVKDYFELLEYSGDHPCFPKMVPNCFVLEAEGSTKYIRNCLKLVFTGKELRQI